MLEDVRYDEHEEDDFETIYDLENFKREEIKYAESYIFRVKYSRSSRARSRVKL
jgi:hypothetical protein